MKNGIVRNWMSSPVVTVTPETHLSEARRIMNAEKIRALPVCQGGKLLGIVTRRGLLRVDLAALDNGVWAKEIALKEETVGDVMTANPITILPGALMPKAARILLENKITVLPVLGEDRTLSGILTASDIFRFLLAELPEIKQDLRVQDYMTSEVVTLKSDDSLLEAHRLMGTKRIRALPVVDGGTLSGLVTRTDLMSSDPSRFASKFNQEFSLRILTRSVSEIMTPRVISIRPDATILEAAQILLENKIHCLPVLNADNQMVGILTESDLFRLVIQKFF